MILVRFQSRSNFAPAGIAIFLSSSTMENIPENKTARDSHHSHNVTTETLLSAIQLARKSSTIYTSSTTLRSTLLGGDSIFPFPGVCVCVWCVKLTRHFLVFVAMK
jgi:hypothetical protein